MFPEKIHLILPIYWTSILRLSDDLTTTAVVPCINALKRVPFNTNGWSPKGRRGKENTSPAQQQVGFKPGIFGPESDALTTWPQCHSITTTWTVKASELIHRTWENIFWALTLDCESECGLSGFVKRLSLDLIVQAPLWARWLVVKVGIVVAHTRDHCW